MDQTMLEWIRSRRSTRRFAARAPERELIEAVVEAGRYAPSGGNSQSTRFIVIRDPAVLAKLAEQVQAAFAAREVTPGMYCSMENSIRASKKGGYVFHYNAPVLIVTANRRDYGNSMADCACALENIMLEANALDLGNCWINQLRWLQDDPALLAELQRLGMAEDERVYGALAVGWPAEGLPVRTPLERHGNPVIFVE